MKPTQTIRVLRLLQDARTRRDGVCCTVFLNIDQRIPRAAARVSELRAGGYVIDTVKCDQHSTAPGSRCIGSSRNQVNRSHSTYKENDHDR